MIYGALFSELVRTEIQLWELLDSHLRSDVGVTVSQFQALSAVEALAGTARVQDISAALSITVGATSKLVDRLERDGLASRQSHPDDRRSSVIVLTEAGKSAQAAATLESENYLESILKDSRISVTELREALAELRERAIIGTNR